MSRRLLATVALGAVLASVLLAAPTSPAGAQEDRTGDGTVDRVLVLSLPTVSWDEVRDQDLPALQSLFEGSAIANLSVRGITSATDAGDGYTTMGAGGRARGPLLDAGAAYDVGELVEGEGDGEGDPAGQVFTRRTGVEAPAEGVVSIVGPAIADRNRGLPYDTEVGALAEALDEADVQRAVVANADRTDAGRVDDRTAVLGIADGDGAVPSGRVGDDLLLPNVQAAGGLELDEDVVVDATAAALDADRAVVLVEASDIVRVDAVAGVTTSDQTRAQRTEALEATDRLVGRLLDEVDPEHDAVLVVAPWHRAGGPHLTVAALQAPGVEPGLLRSASTRRTGVVTLVDVAPTVLDLLGIEAPTSMEGTPFERSGSGGSWDERLDGLITEDEASRFRDDLVAPLATTFVLVQLVLWVVAAIALRRSRWLLRQVAWTALSTLVFLSATYWAGLLPFERWGTGAYVGFVVGISVVVGFLLPAVFRRQPVDSLIAALTIVVGTLVLDVVFLGATMQLSTPFGYSPTIGGRFAGLGNLAFGQLAAGSIVLAGLVAHRLRATRGPDDRMAVLAAAGIIGLAVVVDGAPMWGSDVGGVLALLPGGALTVYLLQGRRVRVRTVVVAGVAAVAAVVVFGLLDLARPPESRTHLGRLFESIGDDGFAAFNTVVTRKLDANFSVLGRSVWTLMLPVVAAFVIYLLWRAPRLLHHIEHALPERDAILAGFAVTAVLGFALNDSGIAVPGVMLGVLNASLVHELAVEAGILSSPSAASAPQDDAAEPDGPPGALDEVPAG
jgi:hypothetical protein